MGIFFFVTFLLVKTTHVQNTIALRYLDRENLPYPFCGAAFFMVRGEKIEDSVDKRRGLCYNKNVDFATSLFGEYGT